MAFTRPEVLLLVPVLGALVLFLGPARKSLAARGLRALILALLLTALAGPYREHQVIEPRGTVLAADASGSVSPAGRAELDALAEELEATPIEFGDPVASDARAALLTAAGRGPARVVLATDGHLDGAAAPLLADLARHRAAGALAIASEAGESAVPPLLPPVILPPPALAENEPALVRVHAEGAEEVRLIQNGVPVGAAPVEDGEARFSEVRFGAGRTLLVAVARRGDGRSAAGLDVDVPGPLRVAVLGEGPAAAALAAQGFAVVTDPPDLAGFQVVLVQPDRAAAGGLDGLLPFVSGGGGLFVASGPPPNLARLAESRAGDLLPAVPEPAVPEPAPPPEEPPPPEENPPEEGASPARTEKEASTLSLLILVDRSGSMGGMKLALAKTSCYAAAQTLDPRDRIGVIAFSDEFEWVRPLSPAGELRQLEDALLDLTAGGGTEIFPAMKEAARALGEESSAVRHVILVSDGQDLISGFHSLVRSMAEQRITVSTIGIGYDYDPRFLGSLARWGRGRFHDATDPRRLPQLVTLDAKKVMESAEPPPDLEPSPDVTSGPPPIEEPPDIDPPPAPPPDPVRLAASADLPFLAGIALPPLPEVEPCRPRFPARIAARTEAGDPALLFWRYGAGRVALLPGDTGAWAAWPDLPRFLAQVTRHLAGGEDPADRVPGPGTEIAGGHLRVRAASGKATAVVIQGGSRADLPLRSAGEGLLTAALPAAEPGALVLIEVEEEGALPVHAAYVSPPPPELRDIGLDAAAIALLNRAAGGPPGGLPPPPEPERRPGRDPLHLPLLIAALILLPLDVASRRLLR